MLEQNVRIYSNCPKKALLPDIMEYNPSSSTRIKLILGLCMPKNEHAWMILRFICVQIYIKKKKDRPTDPPKFQAKRANKPFIF